jgi:hypothetical protein
MVRDAILAAVFHRFLPVSVLCDASASRTLCGVKFLPKFFPSAADGLAMNVVGLPDLGVATVSARSTAATTAAAPVPTR